MVGAALLAAADLWAVQARAVGSLLDAVGIDNEVVVPATSDDALPRIGEGSRSGTRAEVDEPFILLDPPAAKEHSPAAGFVALGVLAAAVAAAVRLRMPPAAKALAVIVAAIAAGSVAYGAWWSARAPIDVATLVVDWRTAAVAPVIVVALAFASEVYPVPGNIALKTVWLWLALVATTAFSVIRLALVAAAYDTFGHGAFLATFHLAGVFWDVVPGLAVLVLADVAVDVGAGRRSWGRRR